MIDKWFPSTQLCPRCGGLNKLGLADRVYNCSCGYSEDRDIHSARNIALEGLRKINAERINKMLNEKESSTSKVDESNLMVRSKTPSMTSEAITENGSSLVSLNQLN